MRSDYAQEAVEPPPGHVSTAAAALVPAERENEEPDARDQARIAAAHFIERQNVPRRVEAIGSQIDQCLFPKLGHLVQHEGSEFLRKRETYRSLKLPH